MHSGSSNIKVPIDCDVQAGGLALRDGAPAPKQQFVRLDRSVTPGDLLLNPGTHQIHRVLELDAESVMISTATGPLVVSWQDLHDTVWMVRDEG